MIVNFINPNKYSAYILGLFIADGSIYYKKPHNHIRFEMISEDINNLEYIFMKCFKWNKHIRKRNKWKETTTFYKNSKELSLFLQSKNFHQKNNIDINFISKKLLRYFLLGYIDGDGCYYFNSKLHLRQFCITENINFDWNFIINILNELKIKYTISKNIDKKGYRSSRLRITGKDNIIKLKQFLYPKNFEFGLKRKYIKLNELINN